jgi:protein TonB
MKHSFFIFLLIVSSISSLSALAQSTDSIYNAPDVLPEFPGGLKGLSAFLSQNVRYPALAQENHIEGRVLVRFVINSEGTPEKAYVIHPVHPDLDREALRVVRLLPKWKPGEKNGQPVSVWFTLPISFKLSTPPPVKTEETKQSES